MDLYREPSTVEQLLEHREALRRIVVRLIGPADADDVVQETYARALAAPPAQGEVARWLARIARNVVSTWRRDQRRRARRELRAAWSGVQEARPTDELLAELEALERVSRALRELPEPYRGTLVLRFVQGASTERIAAEQGVGQDAVRQRLKRGLDLLRGRLVPSPFHRRALALAFAVPVDRLVPVVPVVPVGAGSVAPVSTWWLTAVWSAGLMSKKSVVAGAFLLVAAATAVVWIGRIAPGSGTATSPPLGSGGSGRVADAAVPETGLEGDRGIGDVPVVRREAVVGGGSEAGVHSAVGTLELHVRWQGDGTPAAGVVLQLQDFAYASPPRPVPTAETDEAGVALFENLAPGRHPLNERFGMAGAPRVVEILAGERARLDVEISRGVRVRGRVVDDEGASVPGATLVTSPGVGLWAEAVATADEDGRFELEAPLGGMLGALAFGYRPSSLVLLRPGAGAVVDEVLELSSAGAVVEVQVRGPDGSALAEAAVAAGPFGEQRSPRIGKDRRRHMSIPTPRFTDDHGRARLPVPAGAVELQVSAPGCAGWRETIAAAAGETLRIDVRLGAVVILEGVARDSAGTALPRVRIDVGEEGMLLHRSAYADSDGHFRLVDLPAGALQVRALHAGAQEVAVLQAVEGQELRWDPVFAAGRSVRGLVLDPDDRPVDALGLVAVATSEPHFFASLETDVAGRFELLGVPPDAVLRINALGGRFDPVLFEGPLDERTMPADSLILRWDPARGAPRSKLVGSLRDLQGRVVPAARILVDREGSTTRLGLAADESGDFEFVVPAGTYRLLVEAEGFARHRTDSLEVARDATADFGELVLEPPAAFEIELAAAAGDVPERLHVFHRRRGTTDWSLAFLVGGRGGADGLAPGDYELQVGAPGFAWRRVEAHFRADETTRILETLRSGSPLVFSVDVSAGQPVPSKLQLRIEDAEGRVVVDQQVATGEGGVVRGDWRLEAGYYSAEVSGGAMSGRTAFDVAGDGPVEVTLPLR